MGPITLVRADGKAQTVTMTRPEPPDSDVVVERVGVARTEFRYVGMSDGVPVYREAVAQ
jgi:hypothetical protein